MQRIIDILLVSIILVPALTIGCTLGSSNGQHYGHKYEAKIKKFLCVNANPDVVQNMSCYMKPHNLENQSINSYISFVPSLELNTIKAQLTAYFKASTSNYDKLFVSTKEDLCVYLNGDKSDVRFFRIVQKQFALHGNMDHPCPYSGELFLKNWFVENCVFDSYIPHGNWRFDVQFFTMINGKEVPILEMIFFIDVKSDVDTKLEKDDSAK